jgi:signal transduction histidine kinase
MGIRSGPATAVVVSLRFEPEAVTLTVHDDWVGASPLVLSARAESGASSGLRGIRERVSRLQGTLRAGPANDGGFVVRARVPFRNGGGGP